VKAALAIAALASGCTLTDSNLVATADLHADLQIVATGAGGSTASAWLFSHRAGDPPLDLESIRLVDGDTISVTSNGRSIAMEQSSLVVEYRYDATFETAAADQRYELALARTGDASAPHSTVTLPAPFTPSVPTAAARSAPLAITWSPSGSSDPIAIHITGCASAELGPLADTGSVTVPVGALVAESSDATCDLAIDVTRTRTGTLDRAYGQGGSIVAIQQRSLTLTSTP
jgi:hypothetical protein